jgi:anti-sigma B factor antagonist
VLAGDRREPGLIDDSPSIPFSAALQSLDGSAVFVVVGELDMDTVPELIRVIDPLVEDGPSEVVLDFSGLSFIDSSGIAALVRAQNRLHEQSRRLVVRSPQSQAVRVLEVVGLSGFIGIEVPGPRECLSSAAPTNRAATNH